MIDGLTILVVATVGFVAGFLLRSVGRTPHRCERFTGTASWERGRLTMDVECVDCGRRGRIEQSDAGGDGPYRTAQVPRDRGVTMTRLGPVKTSTLIEPSTPLPPPRDNPPPPPPRNLNHEVCAKSIDADLVDALHALVEANRDKIPALLGKPINMEIATEGGEEAASEMAAKERDARPDWNEDRTHVRDGLLWSKQ